MRIFDDIERTYTGPADNAEGHFDYLNRSAIPKIATVRSVLEEWFSAYPLDHQRKKRSSLRSKHDTQHNSAYFELFLHEVFLKLGFDLVLEPSVDNARNKPDFMVNHDGITQFYIEATVVHGESREEEVSRKFESEIQDFINDIPSPDFTTLFRTVKRTAEQPQVGKFKKAVAEFIKTAQWDAVKEMQDSSIISKDMTKSIHFRGWEIMITLIAKGIRSSSVRNIGVIAGDVWNEDMKEIENISYIRGAIKKKVAQHRGIDSPYIIALNLMHEFASAFPLDRMIGQALWDHQGMLRNGNTRISAILVFLRASPSYIPKKFYVCHNPWARYPLPPIPRLPRLELIDDRFVPVAGDPLTEILGLPPNWPGE